MASFEKRSNKLLVRINTNGFRKSKAFDNEEDARIWAAQVENILKSPNNLLISDFHLSEKKLKRLYSRTKSNSKLNNIGHLITYERFVELWEMSENRCAISGLRFSDYRPTGCRRRPFTPSVDRIDCNKGYSEENIRFVCVAANIARSDFPDDVLYMLAHGITSYVKKVYSDSFRTKLTKSLFYEV